jgi:hypothetical protein
MLVVVATNSGGGLAQVVVAGSVVAVGTKLVQWPSLEYSTTIILQQIVF